MRKPDWWTLKILTEFRKGKAELPKIVKDENKRKACMKVLNQLLSIGIENGGKYPKVIRVYTEDLTLKEVSDLLKKIINDVEVEVEEVLREDEMNEYPNFPWSNHRHEAIDVRLQEIRGNTSI